MNKAQEDKLKQLAGKLAKRYKNRRGFVFFVIPTCQINCWSSTRGQSGKSSWLSAEFSCWTTDR